MPPASRYEDESLDCADEISAVNKKIKNVIHRPRTGRPLLKPPDLEFKGHLEVFAIDASVLGTEE
jgi:hypothetical protein